MLIILMPPNPAARRAGFVDLRFGRFGSGQFRKRRTVNVGIEQSHLQAVRWRPTAVSPKPCLADAAFAGPTAITCFTPGMTSVARRLDDAKFHVHAR